MNIITNCSEWWGKKKYTSYRRQAIEFWKLCPHIYLSNLTLGGRSKSRPNKISPLIRTGRRNGEKFKGKEVQHAMAVDRAYGLGVALTLQLIDGLQILLRKKNLEMARPVDFCVGFVLRVDACSDELCQVVDRTAPTELTLLLIARFSCRTCDSTEKPEKVCKSES